MNFSLLRDIKNLKEKTVLLRADFNVPIKDGVVFDDFRIRKVLPTVDFLLKNAKRTVIISHHSNDKQSLAPVARHINKTVNSRFISDPFKAGALDGFNEGLVVCENLRFWRGEKENDQEFAKRLSLLADFYVNDAFSASHRRHASIVSVPKFLPSSAGFLFEEEFSHLSIAFDPPAPFVFIIGGAKAKTKLPLVERFLSVADAIFVGGALADNFFKARGFEIGASLIEDAPCDVAAMEKSGKIILPHDVVVKGPSGARTVAPDKVQSNERILDAGPETLSHILKITNTARFILWNGPLGDYEEEGFERGTKELISILGKSNAQTVVGGGDTIAMISQTGSESLFDFISTAGGAMIEFLAEKTLPGIEALKARKTRI